MRAFEAFDKESQARERQAEKDRQQQREEDDFFAYMQSLKRRSEGAQKQAGEPCPRCIEKGATHPGRLSRNIDGDLSCFLCGHIVYTTLTGQERQQAPHTSQKST